MKKNKKIFLVLLCFCVVGISSWIYIKKYPIQALSIYSYIKEQPPVVWNNVRVDFNFGIHYYDHGDSISFHYWGKEGQEGVSIVKDFILSEDEIINSTKSQDVSKVLSISSGYIDGHPTIEVDKIKKINGEFFKNIYIPDLKIAIGYGGPADRFVKYQHIISSIHIINTTPNR